MEQVVIPIFLFAACVLGLSAVLIVLGNLFNPGRVQPVKRMPYESGMDPIHDTRRRFTVRFHLLAIAFIVFDVELLFLYPWAVASRPAEPSRVVMADGAVAVGLETPDAAPAVGIDAAVARGTAEGYVENRHLVFGGVMVFLLLLLVGFVYDWRKGIFRWR
jgi:NADH-quinone oxidoreductase subunit A